MKLNDVVYVVKRGPLNSVALRYSLRSLRNISYKKVYIAGDKPDWARVEHIDIRDKLDPDSYKNRLINVQKKILACCENDDISEDFILFNDDFFIMSRQDSIPYYHKGLIPRYKNPNGYQSIVMRTAAIFDNPLHFGVHVPIILNKVRLLDMFNKYRLGLEHRILYGNLYNVEAIEMRDCKVYGSRIMTGGFLSSNNKLEADKKFISFLNDNFPNPCNHEVDLF